MVRELRYFERKEVIWIILGSFALLTLPMTIARATGQSFYPYFELTFFAVFGATHFVVTFMLYMRGRDLDYFQSSTERLAIFFGIPLACAALYTSDMLLQRSAPLLSGGLFLALMIFGFVHVVRQAFGFLQIFEGLAGLKYPAWTRTMNNRFFLTLSLLQIATLFQRGQRFTPSDPVTLVLCGIALILGAGVFLSHVHAVQSAPTLGEGLRSVRVPFVYWVLQSFSAALSIYRTQYFIIGLAMHYVEYHVIMWPRCFVDVEPGSVRSWADRARLALTSNPAIYYGLLLLIALPVTAAMLPMYFEIGPDSAWRYGGWFKAVMLAHYTLDIFFWRFSDPYFGRTLRALYTQPLPINLEFPVRRVA